MIQRYALYIRLPGNPRRLRYTALCDRCRQKIDREDPLFVLWPTPIPVPEDQACDECGVMGRREEADL